MTLTPAQQQVERLNNEVLDLLKTGRINGLGGSDGNGLQTGVIETPDEQRTPFTFNFVTGTLTIDGTEHPNITAWLDTRDNAQEPAGDDGDAETDQTTPDA